jgi:hypothetical protein
MALFTFWSGDVYAATKSMTDISIQKEYDVAMLASLMNQDDRSIEARLKDGNEAWIVRFEGTPVSFGWVSRGRARIGELSKEIELPERNAYLWNFRTLEPYRGRGYYVHLLITILFAEEKTSDRMWIISAPENQSSFNGIIKAGFKPVGDIMFDYKNEVVLLATTVNERTQAGADLIQLPITTTEVRPCWKCASKTMKKEAACDCREKNLPCCCSNPNGRKDTQASGAHAPDRLRDIL